MLKSVLLFLAGLLVGANLAYFFTARPGTPDPRSDVPAPSAQTPEPGSVAGPPQAGPTRPSTPGRQPLLPARAGGVTGGAPAPAPPPSAALLLPVAGISASQLSDTFNEARGGGSRVHEALDIMAPRGTPVLAAVDGKVEKLFTSDAGGLTIYQFDASGTYCYYYAHLDAYAPGLREGQQLRRGDVIGTVGSTGNANPDGPHLHFAIFLLGPEKRWHEGTPVNPYPLLVAR